MIIMNNNLPSNKNNFSSKKSEAGKFVQNIAEKTKETVKKAPKSVKMGVLAGLFLLPTLGIITNTCSSSKKDKEMNTTVAVYDTNYIDKTERMIYIVQNGDCLGNIAKKNGVSTMRLLAENSLTKNSVIHPEDTLIIPQKYVAKNISSAKDVAKMMGFTNNYINYLSDIEKVKKEVYLDVNGNSSIGIGHLLKDSEAEKYTKPLKDDEIYTILAQDLLDINEDLKVLIGEDVYKDIPVCVKESVIDLAFNKGLGAVRDNSELFNGLKNKDYVKVVSNLTQDYSLVKNKNGQLVKVYLSGLNKRRLWEMNNASKIFEDNIPQEVLQSAQKVYTNGIKNMGTEVARGKISQEAYPNILAEYNLTVSKMFDGKISANSEIKDVKKNIDTSKDNTKTVLVKGKSSNFTVSTLHAEWQKTAEKNKRFIKRPLPVVNANGNIVADIKTYEPTKKGILSGKTIIINSGHGGCMANVSGEKINVNFDPGTSNAKMNSKNSNIETNQFIGNGGKALEEWDVNRKFSDNLIKKITSEGGKVIYVQGSVHTAMTAIRNIVAKNKINLLISLHSNSAGSERGIFVMPNDRGGLDKKDDELANSIVNNLNADSWFKGITHKKPKSLGVLSADKNTTLPIPAVLIETGNLKNEKDVANLNSSNFKEKMMSSIFEGIEDYLIK